MMEKNNKRTEESNSKKYIDNFIYIFLIFFITICMTIKLEFWQIILLAIIFCALILFIYLLIYRSKKINLLNKKYEQIDKLTTDDLIRIFEKHYKELGYTVLKENENIYIEKKGNIYKLYILNKKVTLDILRTIKSETIENIKGKIIITNKLFNKECLEFVKKNNIFSITKPGLIDIYSKQDSEGEK